MNKSLPKRTGFTIVELLVVIVVIGILAAITIVAYTGISNRAKIASLQTDLTNASNQLKLYQVQDASGNYPTAIDCSATPAANTICLKNSPNNSYTYTPNNSASPKTFTLDSTNSDGTKYRITNDSASVAVNPGWIQIVAAYDFTCAVADSNQAYCWGYNSSSGSLGNNSTADSYIPVAVNTAGVLNGKTIKAIDTGNSHACVVASDNNAYCWGFNAWGTLGNNSTNDSYVPVAVNTAGVLSGKTIKSISAGDSYTCIIASDDNSYCWGYNNSYGQLGNNSTVNSSVPVAVNTAGVLSGKTIKSISAGNMHVCVIASDDNAYCWGRGGSGELGNNSTTDSYAPVAVNTAGVLSGKTIKSISAGFKHTCVVASDDQAYCWGDNSQGGELGNNSTVNSSVPVSTSPPL